MERRIPTSELPVRRQIDWKHLLSNIHEGDIFEFETKGNMLQAVRNAVHVYNKQSLTHGNRMLLTSRLMADVKHVQLIVLKAPKENTLF